MCFCCCTTRKSILIYSIVISSFAFIYGIVAISKFGSNTEIYKVLITKLKELESNTYSDSKSSNSNNNFEYNSYSNYYKTKSKKNRRIAYDNDDYYYPNLYGNSKYAEAILNSASYIVISNLRTDDLKIKKYNLIKSLKGIENGLGVILFIFPILFLGIEILFLIFTCGIKEYKVLPLKYYKNHMYYFINIIYFFISII